MFPQDYKEKDISGEGVPSKGLQEAGLHLGTLLWRLAHAWDSILSRLTHPRAWSQRLSKQKAQAEVQLESPQQFPPSPSPPGGPGLPALWRTFPYECATLSPSGQSTQPRSPIGNPLSGHLTSLS